MGDRKALFWSWLRLTAVLAFIAIGVPTAQAEDEGGCSPANGYACAKTSVVYDKKCVQGSTGGCENCSHTGNPEDQCFYNQSSEPAVGYLPSPPA
ncbi:MAG: hypothetical protein MUD17_12480 [Gemmatimonadaceae bacterium]|jgi:hypothetical protein|nr:hypothetical protein [Gemmatimonadaceae bacterium]